MSTPEVDVVYLLEGDEPGDEVSAWVWALMQGLPELSFGLLRVTSDSLPRGASPPPLHPPPLPRGASPPPLHPPGDYPANLEYILEVAPHDLSSQWGRGRLSGRSAAWPALEAFHRELPLGRLECFPQLYQALGDPRRRPLGFADLMRAPQVWDALTAVYQERAADLPFADYYQSWRATHLPLLHLMGAEIPRARLYHSLSAGWPGLLGVLARYRHHRPLLLTDHTRPHSPSLELSYLGVLWTRLGQALRSLTYQHCDGIFPLSEASRQVQTELGAPPQRLQPIPPGVALERWARPRPAGDPGRALQVGTVGSVVPARDLKTFIRAARMVVDQLTDVEFLVVGPTDADPEYLEECQALVELLHLRERLRFLGPAQGDATYLELDLQVSTSLSEGDARPLLEGFGGGLPCVATRVAAHPEIVEGLLPEDCKLGPAGLLAAPGDARQIAEAILRVLRDRKLWTAMSQAAQARVRQHYSQQQMVEAYRQVYEIYRQRPQSPPGSQAA